MPAWFTPFITFFPLNFLFFLGAGIPWALVLLPRHEWRNRLTVIGLGFALGPLFSTTWLFLLGTFGTFESAPALTGVILLAVIGITGAWLRRHTPYQEPHLRPEAWTTLERWLVVLLALGMGVVIWTSQFWPFIQYDTLWTFGANPRMYLHYEEIPKWIGYYPQLIPMTYTFSQLVHGGIDDHIARAAISWYLMGTVIMTYLLGWRIWGKRSIGIIAACFWLLLPTSLQWASAGDLEHPIALYFTAAILFFIMAWRSHQWRYAAISGLMLAGALWTKPTGGAFGLGVVLVMVVTTLRLWHTTPLAIRWQLISPLNGETITTYRQKMRIAIITALFSLPIGGMWYMRNWYYDQEILVFPADFWHDLAQRSGQELGWLMLIALLAALWFTQQVWDQPAQRRRLGMVWLGLGLFLLGSLPNALGLSHEWTSYSLWEWAYGARPPNGRLNLLELLLIGGGLGLMAWALWPSWNKASERVRSSTVLTVLLITPFAIVWFFNFSYHFRLVLTITPALTTLTAAMLEGWLWPWMHVNRLRERTALFLATCLCIPGLVMGSWFTAWYTWADPLEDDQAKYAAANPTLMEGVEKIAEYSERTNQEQVYVYTGGDPRYQFFFPQMFALFWTWRPLTLNELYKPTHLIFGGSHADFYWEMDGHYPNQITAYMDVGFHYSQALIEYGQGSVMGLPLQPIGVYDDGNDRLIVFHYYLPYRNYTLDDIQPPFRFEEDQWEILALRGMDVRRIINAEGDSEPMLPAEDGPVAVKAGEAIYLQLYWQRPTDTPIGTDYTIFIHLIDLDTEEILSQRDAPLMDGLMPTSLMAYPDLVPDRRAWVLPDDLRAGEVSLLIGLVNPATGQRLPLADGSGDVLRLDGYLRVE